jgi:CHAT domain-containing protein
MTPLNHDMAGRPLRLYPSFCVFAALLSLVLLGVFVPSRACAASSADSPRAAVELHPAHSISETVSTGTPIHYWFAADRDAVFRLGLEQHDMRLRVTVVRPDGVTLLESSTPLSGLTSIVAATTLAGTYSVTAIPEQIDGRVRQFSICLEELAPLSPRLSTELSASAALEAGDQLSSQWTESSFDQALARYREAENAWRRAGDMEEASSALVRQGGVHAIRGQFKAALASYQAALNLVSNGPRVDRRIDILNSMAALALTFDDIEEAKKDAESANSLSLANSYQDGRGRALSVMGGVELFSNNNPLAQSYLDQAMSIWAKTPDRRAEAFTLTYSSYVNSSNSAYALAFDQLTRALRISRSHDDRFAQARALADLGNHYLRIDELEQARDSYNAALDLLATMGSVDLEAIVLDDFGYYLENVGDPNSYRIYKRASLLAQHTEHPLVSAAIQSDLCRASIAAGNAAQALQYSKSERQLASSLRDGLIVSQSLRDTGDAYMSAGRVSLALKYFTQAVDPKLVGPGSAERAKAQIEVARALESLGRAPEALETYREAAALSQSLGIARAEADARYRIARLETAEGQLDSALPEIEKSASLVESLRTKVSADDTRILWFASFHSIYTLYIDVLMQLSSEKADAGRSRHAFQIAEQSIARSFVELLHEAQVEEGDSQDLIREDSSVRRLLAEKTKEESRLLASSSGTEATRKVASEISDLQERAAQLQSLLQTKEPEYFQTQVEPLGVDKVQSLIGDEEIVLEYSLGTSHSYLWAIGKNGFSSYVLPPDAEIEPAVRRFRQAVVSPIGSFQGDRRQGRHAGRAENEERLAIDLGHMLLSPVPDLNRYKRIVVVADGALQYLPFGVLIADPGDRDSSGEMQRIADRYEVTNLPSMTALSVLRSRRNLNGAPSKEVVVFADPVFERDDPRIDPATQKKTMRVSAMNPDQATSSAEGLSQANRGFPRLPGSRQEAAVIREVAQNEDAEILLGFDANRNRALSPEIGNYRYLHFATHSVFDDEHPQSSGVILSLFAQDGSPEDGYVRLRDIYDMRLSADLVVLSACDTALGKNIKGEGIVGLTRGFMYAGAPRVVATLWRVDDDATSEFMKWFYTGILQKHESPAASLREAQMRIRKQARWRSPYYWGAFVIEGEWRSENDAIGDVAR